MLKMEHEWNRTVPMLDLLELWDAMDERGEPCYVAVMPILMQINNPPFETRAEVIHALKEMLMVLLFPYNFRPFLSCNCQGLAYMHSLGVSHGYASFPGMLLLTYTAQ